MMTNNALCFKNKPLTALIFDPCNVTERELLPSHSAVRTNEVNKQGKQDK